MAKAFDRDQLLAAFDRIGREAASHDTILHIVIYGGSALMLASNFRFSSEDVDIAPFTKPWPRGSQMLPAGSPPRMDGPMNG